jgi:hypothetical protein
MRVNLTVGDGFKFGCGLSLAAAFSFVVLVLESSRWEIYVASTLLGVGIGLAFASLANLIVEAVPRDQTGVATGMNTIVRTIGGAFGAQVAVSILSANTLSDGFPSEHGYTITFAICLPLMQRFRHVRMPLIARRWYDIPLRASLVATLVATVVVLSRWVGPGVSGAIALFPVVFTSMMLILHPRMGGRPTAAVIANGGWGLMGFGIAIAVLQVTAPRFGSAVSLSLALATCVIWNLGLWWNGRRKFRPVSH